MDDFYTLKDEVLLTIKNIPKYSTFTSRDQKECAEHLTTCIPVWQRIQSNANLTSSMKASLFDSIYHSIDTCHITFCSICKNMNHKDRHTYITHLLDTSPDTLLESCTSK